MTDLKPSKSARKREFLALQKLGEELIALKETDLREIGLDPDLLEATAVELTPLTNGFSLVPNLTNAGQVVASLARATGIASGSGALVEVEFKVKANVEEGA